MSYLAMFHWGWLVGALLLGFVAGWISVVQRGRGVSKVTARWLAALVAALLVAPPLRTSSPAVPATGSTLGWCCLACISSAAPSARCCGAGRFRATRRRPEMWKT